MRVGVYNRYWSTGGGAEKYGGVIAEQLARHNEVDLLGHDGVDRDSLAARLQLDLAEVKIRELDDSSGAVTRASRDYDLFVNVSYMSADRAANPHSLYVVHFPTSPEGHLSRTQRFAVRHLGALRTSAVMEMEWGTGFYHRDRAARGPFWTNGDATLRITTPPGRSRRVQLVFGYHRPPQLAPTTARIEIDGETAALVRLERPRNRLRAHLGQPVQVDVCSRREGQQVELRIVSDTFVPAELTGGADTRRLGVSLLGLRVGAGPITRLARWFPVLMAPPVSTSWLRSYGAIVANSRYTQQWIERYWDMDSELLYPPVTMHPAGEKQPIILSVGRFFPPSDGHSKKQLELVRAFRDLCDQGLVGWTLHLVGGCSAAGEPYLAKVRELALGYPVEVHVNASGEELRRLYGAATIYWHAAGLGENDERHPDRLEHFGISTVEAMSAGAVPVVIGLAGQRETVRHGVDGFHFRTLDGLVGLTQMLLRDEGLRAAMSTSAAARARSFAIDAFGVRLDALIDRVMTDGAATDD
jgi:glycosyltransferase involved in cell wall biosynthesis